MGNTTQARQRRVNKTLARVSKMDFATQGEKAEALLLTQLNRIDQGSPSLEERHYAVSLHTALADLYTALGRTQRAAEEHECCARFSGAPSHAPLSLCGYLLYLYGQEGRREAVQEHYAEATERFLTAAQFAQRTKEGEIPPHALQALVAETAESQAGQGHCIQAAHTLLDHAEALPDSDLPERAQWLMRAAEYARQGGDYGLSRDCLELVAALYSSTKEQSLWTYAVAAVIQMGEQWLMQSDLTRAKAAFLRADRMAGEKREAGLEFSIAMGLGKCAEREDDLLSAVDFYLEAGRAAIACEQTPQRIHDIAAAHLDGARLVSAAGLPGEKAVEILTFALDVLCGDRDGGSDAACALLYSRRGIEQYQCSHFAEEYDDYSEAIRLYESMSARRGRQGTLNLVSVYVNRAETANRLKGLGEAEKDLKRAETLVLEAAQESPARHSLMEQEVYFEWGKLYDGQKQFAQAEGKYTQALECARQFAAACPQGERTWVAEHKVRILERRGRLLFARSAYGDARADFARAVTLLQGLSQTDATQALLARMLQGQSDCLMAEEKRGEALTLLQQAIPLRQALLEKGHTVDSVLAGDYLCAGRLCEEMKNYNEAASYYKDAIELYERIDRKEDLERLANAHYRLGNTLCALEKHLYAEVARHYGRSLNVLGMLADSPEVREMKAVIYRGRGALFANMHEYELARADFGRAKQDAENVKKT